MGTVTIDDAVKAEIAAAVKAVFRPVDPLYSFVHPLNMEVAAIRDTRSRIATFYLNKQFQRQFLKGTPLRKVFKTAVEEEALSRGYRRGFVEGGRFVPNDTSQGPAYWVRQK